MNESESTSQGENQATAPNCPDLGGRTVTVHISSIDIGYNQRMVTWLIDMGYVTKASKGRFKLDYIAARNLIEICHNWKMIAEPAFKHSLARASVAGNQA